MSAAESAKPEILELTKLDAARRQLHTAIALWFTNGDPVSIHTLAAAAYEIIHIVTKKRMPTRQRLLFDSLSFTDDERKPINNKLRSFANFFKHADKDADAILRFNPSISEGFIVYSVLGVWTYDTVPNFFETTFMAYIQFHRPHWLTDEGQKILAENVPVNILQEIKSLSKNDFFDFYQAHFEELRENINVGATLPHLNSSKSSAF
jgi:hypothetical protein